MLKIILCYIVLISKAFSFETLSIYNESAIELLKQPTYLIGEMSHSEAYKKCKNNNFLALPEKAINSGYDHTILWICLELRKETDKELFLSLTDPSLSNVTFFKYRNDKFIEENIQNIQNNSFDKYIPKILLEQSVLPTTYLIEIKSPLPYIISMLIANSSEILTNQLIEIIIFFTFIGIFLALFIYNLFLFFATKQNEYLLYSIIILFLVVWNFVMYGFFNIIFNLDHNLIHIIKTFSFIGISFFLLIFNIQFFNLRRNRNTFKFLLLALVPLYFILLKIEDMDQCCSIYMLFVILSMCIYLSFDKYKNKYRPSKYYLIAIVGYFIGTLITVLMFEGILSSNFYNLEAHLIGTIWLMIFLALALGDRIKLLQLERNEAVLKSQIQEKMLFLQSKYASIGELVSNITHQWREPLAEIGAIQTNMQAVVLLNNELSKEKLLTLLEENNNIIRHLSDTIDVFYKLFKNEKSQNERINLLKIIQNIEKIIHYILKEEKIEFKYEIDEEIYIYGDKNEYMNVLLNILLNAKDVLVERKILNPLINIIALKENKSIKILIEDNAGGIKQKPISKIFESGITSKDDSIGIGLFITKTILEKRINGNLFAQNGINGAIFTIECPSYKSELVENNNSFNTEETILNRIMY